MPFLLPHEMLFSMVSNLGFNVSDMVTLPSSHLQKMKEDMCKGIGLDPGNTIPLGLHGDGVPHQKAKSIE
eukprot:8955526-Lingulodinium_polyedra.AAC.1